MLELQLVFSALLTLVPLSGLDLKADLDRARRATDPLTASLARAEVYFRARDFAAVLEEVERGLDAEPGHLELLWRGASAELWLQDGEASLRYIGELDRALLEAILPEEEAASWHSAAEELRREAERLAAGAREGRQALFRARVVVTIAAVSSVLIGLWALCRSKPG